jgi:aerobic-type carbon monoxide dehydrogenase small subunit (CoxS/CutS family)
MPDVSFTATVNGRRVTRAVKPFARLLDVLRDDLHLTGTKEGCGAGECGTCSVFVDGRLVKSCLVPVAKVEGADIETVEGLSRSGELSTLQKAFHKTGASQCGYCIPGMVMAATAAIRANRTSATKRSRSASAAISVAAPAIRRSSTRWRSLATCSMAACRRARLPRTRATAASSAPMFAASMRPAKCPAR